MATILRSSRYIRCLNVFAQRITVSHDKCKFANKCLATQARAINTYLTKNYVTTPAIRRRESVTQNDALINKLDESVQQKGRVFKQDVENVLERIRDTGHVSTLDALLLIRCCGELLIDVSLEMRNQLIDEVWSMLNMLKISLDVSHFNALLRVYLENNYNFESVDFLKKMKDAGIEPNKITYQRLIMHHCKQGDLNGATKILEFMRKTGLPLNEGVFNALIIGHSEAGDMESALNIIKVMKEANIEPSSNTFTALSCAYAKRGDLTSILNICDEIKKENLYLTDKDFFEVIYALAANGHSDKVDEILSKMPMGPGYVPEAVIAILKILDIENIDVAMKILSKMIRGMKSKTIDGEERENESGKFLIKKAVTTLPTEKVIELCEKLENSGVHVRAFSFATLMAFINGKVDLGFALLKAWKNHGGEIREHYFWPVLTAKGKSVNWQGVQDVLQMMIKDYQITPGVETIANFVLPYTFGHWEDVIENVKKIGVSHETAVNAFALRLIRDNKIRNAAKFMASHPCEYQADLFYRPLQEALKEMEDADSFVIILRLLYGTPVAEKSEDGGAGVSTTIADNAIITSINEMSKSDIAIVDKILKQMVETGMGLSPDVGNVLRNYYGEDITPERSAVIDQLTSGTLVPIPLSEFKPFAATESDEDVSENPVTQKLFAGHKSQIVNLMKTGSMQGVDLVIEDMITNTVKMSPPIFAKVIDYFTQNEDVEKAEKWVAKYKTVYPNRTLDFYKCINYIGLLVKSDRFDDALQFIAETPKPMPASIGFKIKHLIRDIINKYAVDKDVEKTNAIFHAFQKSNYFIPDAFILSPLLKVHINRNDIESTLDAFETLSEKYNCTPMKNELSKILIEAENAAGLQRVTDLSTKIHGESNSLVDLVLSFLESGRMRQAKKILETPGLRLRGAKLQTTAERYSRDDRIQYLEQFFEITKNCPFIDRSQLYDLLLEVYDKKNNWQRAMGLWVDMQDENVQPSEEFMSRLAQILKKNKKKVPFSVSPVDDKKKFQTLPQYDKFQEAMAEEDFVTAEKILTNSPNIQGYNGAMSLLIDANLSKGDLDNAVRLMEDVMVKKKQKLRAATIKRVWNAMTEAGKLDELQRQGDIIGEDVKNTLRFEKFLARIFIAKHGLSQLLENIESQLTESSQDNMELIRDKLHFTTLVHEFNKDPKLVEKFRPMAEKLADQGILFLVNSMWCHYFETNDPEADVLWSKYLLKAPKVMYRYLYERAKETKNIEMLERLYEKLSEHESLKPIHRQDVAALLIKLYVENEKFNEAAELWSKEGSLIHLRDNSNIMKELKKGLELMGKTMHKFAAVQEQ